MALHDEFEQQSIQFDIGELIDSWRISPPFAVTALNPAFPLRAYQQQTIARFDLIVKKPQKYLGKAEKLHLLFNLATGSGKTLLMASQILRLYEAGYRVFLFFVNSDAVLRKTKENFLETSSKRQFASQLSLNGYPVDVREISSPDDVVPDAINIIFSTIQGLHIRLKTPRENSVTYESLAEHKLVLLADEAHHLNAALGQKLQEEAATWQETVEKLLAARSDNVLLEYTATVDWNNPEIRTKYEPRCLMRYDLKAFRDDLYSKDVYLHLSQGDRNDRLLRACLASYYRSRVAEAHGIPLKPLMLVKSRVIKESASDEVTFKQMLQELTPAHIATLRRAAMNEPSRNIVTRSFHYLDRVCETDTQIAQALATLYSCTMIVNSKNRAALEGGELATLENPDNPVRVVFVVDMLNEGWDVLNLFDIVRLDESDRRDANIKIKDVQLIGRGARYFPFELIPSGDADARFKRKFDGGLLEDLRALEEMHYHSRNNSRFIESLTNALQDAGLQDKGGKEFSYSVKDALKQTQFWKKGELFLNAKVDNGKISAATVWPKTINLALPVGGASEQNALTGAVTNAPIATLRNQTFLLADLGAAVWLKALSIPEAAFFRFAKLSEALAEVDGINQLVAQVIGSIKATVNAPDGFDAKNLPPKTKLPLASLSLVEIEKIVHPKLIRYKGSRKFTGHKVSTLLDKDVCRHFTPTTSTLDGEGHSIKRVPSDQIRVAVDNADWYVYDDNHGTEEEKRLIRLIHDRESDLRKLFTQFVLVRNEKFITLHAFDDGSAFEPDFILWAKHKKSGEILHAYIEPKGQQLSDMEKWKESFLGRIEVDAEPITSLFEQAGYRLLGLPFFSNTPPEKRAAFDAAFDHKILATP